METSGSDLKDRRLKRRYQNIGVVKIKKDTSRPTFRLK